MTLLLAAWSSRPPPPYQDPAPGSQAETGVRQQLSDLVQLAELRASPRGWHGAQLAVLGLIGQCGALQGGGSDLQG